ncbi:bile acid:sodium symporter family protein [Pectinatus haikarae]|uniref:BASS family bile acid:Na+ symporter n=1 Tax=Pectinatus haikarae TaxID=349096 RepID=A0ABT9YA99_9FIRM|nr:bile acid:sodium symporter family protein [Pectinatus haikarae]MDQ0204029.1 BASS family bile acid:Na+ symporter [Pectinatus haikarae]
MIRQMNRLLAGGMPFGVIIAGIIGIMQPSLFIWFTDKIAYFLGVVMLGMGMNLSADDFKTVIEKHRSILTGILLQFIFMPAAAYFIAFVFNLAPDAAAGMILLGACPGATASTVITYMAKGDIALSVSLTMLSTFLAPILTPLLLLFFAGKWISIDFFAVLLSIMEMVFLPVAAGILFNRFCGAAAEKVRYIMPVVSAMTVIILVGTVVSLSAGTLADMGLKILAAVVLYNTCGLAAGYFSARFFIVEEASVRTLAISTGMKNSGLAASLAIMHFTAAAGIPAAIFSVWHNVSGSLLAAYIKNRKKQQLR